MSLSVGRKLLLVVTLLLGAAVGLVLLRGGRADELDRERISSAREVWREMAPTAYTLELEMRGAINERREVVVRDRQVVGLVAGGVDAPESSWEYWSVEGLFDVLETEVSNAENPRKGQRLQEVAVLARFDPTWGYPSYFYRHIMGSTNDIEWEVVGFTVD